MGTYPAKWAHTQLIRHHLATVISACWAIVGWFWPKKKKKKSGTGVQELISTWKIKRAGEGMNHQTFQKKILGRICFCITHAAIYTLRHHVIPALVCSLLSHTPASVMLDWWQLLRWLDFQVCFPFILSVSFAHILFSFDYCCLVDKAWFSTLCTIGLAWCSVIPTPATGYHWADFVVLFLFQCHATNDWN